MEYASPEQVRGEPATQTTDVHALGLVFYEILLDRRPFDVGLLAMYEAARVVCERIPDLGDLTPRLAGIVGKAIRKDAAQRYASVREFAAAIQSYLEAPGWQRLTNRKVRRAFIGAGFLAAAMGLGALLMFRPVRLWRPDSHGKPNIYQLTSYPGIEDHPDLSPDGLSVVFNRYDRGAQGIWWRTIQDGGSGPLTDQTDCCAKWSPDGKQIAFARLAGPDVRDVMLMDAKGGAPRKIGRIQGMNLSWAADGKSLAVVDRPSPDGSFGVFRLNIESGERKALTHPPAGYWGDVECDLSPDGKSLAFTRYASKGDGDLYVTSSSGGEPRLVTNEHTWITGMAWTPDSRSIIFPAIRAKGRPKPNGLWRIPANATPTTEPSWVPGTDEAIPARPAIARRYRNGTVRLVFQAEHWHAKPWTMALSVTGHNLPVRVEDWTSGEEQPALSPNGKQIAFMSNRSTYQEIWVSGLDGSNATQITTIRSLNTAWPRWSPDGSRICFVSRVDGERSIYVVDAGGANLQRIVNSGNDADIPSWSSDGRWIYFRSARSGSQQIWKVAATGEGEPVAVTHGGGVDAYESLDGKFVYFLRSYEQARLWRVPVGPGAEEEVPHAPLLKSGYWAPVEKGVCLIDVYGMRPGSTAIMVRLFPFGSRPVMNLGEMPNSTVLLPGISVRRDAGAFVWAQEEHSVDLFLMDGLR
jgi:Tol biopolymer transport system component